MVSPAWRTGYRPAIVLSFIAEGASVVLLGAYLLALSRQPGSQRGGQRQRGATR